MKEKTRSKIINAAGLVAAGIFVALLVPVIVQLNPGVLAILGDIASRFVSVTRVSGEVEHMLWNEFAPLVIIQGIIALAAGYGASYLLRAERIKKEGGEK